MQSVRRELTKEQYEIAKDLKGTALEEYADTIFPDLIQWWVYWIYNMWTSKDETTGKYWLNARIGDSCD